MCAASAKGRQPAAPGEKCLYTLKVFLIEGPITEEFAEENPEVSRTIQIRSDQTLDELHHAIFEAFDREEEHLYEFQIGGEGPQDPKARCYPMSEAYDSGNPGHARGGEAEETRIGLLGLRVDESFGYWFDFGDDWWHQINVLAIEEQVPKGKYPRITDSVGASPPQYADWEEEDDEDEEYDGEEEADEEDADWGEDDDDWDEDEDPDSSKKDDED